MNTPLPEAFCTTCGHPCSRHAHFPVSKRIGHCLDCSICQKFTSATIAASGEHDAVKEMRAKFESIAEHTIPRVEALNSQIDELSAAISSHPPEEADEEVNEDAIDTVPEGIAPDGPPSSDPTGVSS